MKKKIAFCFSGQARTFELAYPYFKKNLFEAAEEQGFEYDIFCAIEDDGDAKSIEIMNPTLTKKIRSSESEKIIQEKYGNFIKKAFNKKYYFVQSYRYPFVNGLQQFFKIHICNELKNQYQKDHGFEYDIVMRLRFDIAFLNKINFSVINEHVKTGVVLNMIPYTKGVVYDHFAFGNSKNMDIYTSVFIDFENIFKKEIIGAWKKAIVSIDTLANAILKLIFKLSGKNKLIGMVVEKFFFMKTVFLEKKGFYFYNYEKIVYENLQNNSVPIYDANIDFLLIRNNFSENPTILFPTKKFEL